MIPEANPVLSADKRIDESPVSMVLMFNAPQVCTSRMQQLPPARPRKDSPKARKEPERELVYRRLDNERQCGLARSQQRFANSLFSTFRVVKDHFSYDLLGTGGFAPNLPLQFNSRFEAGNLLRVFRVGDAEFELHLQNDVNTKGHPQWFFF
jgi:hypothetical protein